MQTAATPHLRPAESWQCCPRNLMLACVQVPAAGAGAGGDRAQAGGGADLQVISRQHLATVCLCSVDISTTMESEQ